MTFSKYRGLEGDDELKVTPLDVEVKLKVKYA
jgi:hypothetical protein